MKNRSMVFEIIFTAVILLVAGTVTALMFMKANVLQERARDLDRATLAAQTAIEEVKAGQDTGGTYYYDRDFNAVTAPDEDGFVMELTITGENGLYEINVTATKAKPYFGEDETEIIAFNTSVYRGARG